MPAHTYHLVTYSSGMVVAEDDTQSKRAAERIYGQSQYGNCAVRVWRDGIKLTYGQSNRLFCKRDIGFGRRTEAVRCVTCNLS
jgi:hypothetical protein